MDADTSLDSRPSLQRGSLRRVRLGTDYRPGRPTPSVWRERNRTRVPATGSPVADANSWAASFPLFFFGAGCAVLAVYVRFEESGAVIGRIPFWIPLLAFAVIGLVGGTLSLFATPDEPTHPKRDAIPPARDPPPKSRYIPPDRPRRAEPEPAPSVARVKTPAPSFPAAPPTHQGPRPVAAALRTSVPRSEPSADPPSTYASPSELSSLLSEIDSIAADLDTTHATGPPIAAARPTTARLSSVGPPPARTGEVLPPRRTLEPPIPLLAAQDQVERMPARRALLCVGCGSAILGSSDPVHCQVCHETLCGECQDRAKSEGKPGLCPFCSILDEIPPADPARDTTAARRV
jgi:hypothetical protein